MVRFDCLHHAVQVESHHEGLPPEEASPCTHTGVLDRRCPGTRTVVKRRNHHGMKHAVGRPLACGIVCSLHLVADVEPAPHPQMNISPQAYHHKKGMVWCKSSCHDLTAGVELTIRYDREVQDVGLTLTPP